MEVRDKIALLTKIIMEKAEDQAEDHVVEAEGQAEIMVNELMETLLQKHRHMLAEAIEEAKRSREERIARYRLETRHRHPLGAAPRGQAHGACDLDA